MSIPPRGIGARCPRCRESEQRVVPTSNDEEGEDPSLDIDGFIWDVLANLEKNNVALFKHVPDIPTVIAALRGFGDEGGVVLVGFDDQGTFAGIPSDENAVFDLFDEARRTAGVVLQEWGLSSWETSNMAYAVAWPTITENSIAASPLVPGIDPLQGLRLTRSRPPGPAGSGDRRIAYRAALRQFEELHSAATAASPASRPLLLYYATTQAGIAIMAAFGLEMSFPPRHGLAMPSSGRQFFRRTIVPYEQGIFPSMCRALGLDRMTGPVSFGDLWRALPELATQPIGQDRTPEALRVWVYDEGDTGSFAKLAIDRVGAVIPLGNVRSAEDLEVALRPYPTTAGWARYGIGGGIQFAETPEGWGAVIYWESRTASEEDRERRLDLVAPLYRDRGRWLIPAVGGMRQATPPFLSWWVLLYGMSMLCRYEPVYWSRALDIDRSEVAGFIEVALEEALRAIPDLTYELLNSDLVFVDASGQLRVGPPR